MSIEIIQCTSNDAQKLQEISRTTFYDTFAHMNAEESMNAYLENAFQLKKIEEELATPFSEFYFIYDNEQLAGYLKVNVNEAQTEQMGDETLEIERIYIVDKFQQRGLGKHLLHKAIEVARSKMKKKIWLGVWERNIGALHFYNKMGFVQTGTHAFYMGDEEQTDLIMIKAIES